jgi:NAD(P)-dependent dehydrogenase (short-subunit alcohol dehydrogenase family)
MSFSGKRVLITGSARGLGAATVDALVARGARVVGIDKETASSRATLLVADLRDEQQVRKAVAKALEELGGLDLLINNAGILYLADPAAPVSRNVRDSLEVNLFGAWHVTSAAMPALLESRGRVVNVSSLFAVVNAPFIPAYATGKRALTAFSDILRFQYGDRISVVTVYPGFMDTLIHAGAVAQGLSVGALVTFRLGGRRILTLEESLPAAVRGLLAACRARIARDRALTLRGALTLVTARHVPRLVDWFIGVRIRFLVRRGLRVDLKDQHSSPEPHVAG